MNDPRSGFCQLSIHIYLYMHPQMLLNRPEFALEIEEMTSRTKE